MKRQLVEALGTVFVVLTTVGAQLAHGASTGASTTPFVPALAAGLSLSAVLFAFRRAHDGFHPVLTLTGWAAGRVPWRRAASALAAQLAGAFVAIGLLVFLLKSKREGYDLQALGIAAAGIGERSPGHYDWLGLLVLELALSFSFGLLAVAVQPTDTAREHDDRSAWSLAGAYAAIGLVVIPAAGAAMHPAQNIASAAFSGGRAVSDLWLFVAMPVLGALLAGVSSRWLLRER